MKNFKKLIGFALVAVLSLSNATTQSQAALDWAKGAGGWVKGAAKDTGTWVRKNPGLAAAAAGAALGAATAGVGANKFRKSGASLEDVKEAAQDWIRDKFTRPSGPLPLSAEDQQRDSDLGEMLSRIS